MTQPESPKTIDLSPGYVSGATRFELKPFCPTGRNLKGEKDILCPRFKDCTLGRFVVAVRASTIGEAIEVVNVGSELGEVPNCEAGKPYAFKDPDTYVSPANYRDGSSYHRDNRMHRRRR